MRRFAAMRYTEARLTRFAQMLIRSWSKGRWTGNRTSTARSGAAVVPRAPPHVLLNGTTGIAVGMATDIAAQPARGDGSDASGCWNCRTPPFPSCASIKARTLSDRSRNHRKPEGRNPPDFTETSNARSAPARQVGARAADCHHAAASGIAGQGTGADRAANESERRSCRWSRTCATGSDHEQLATRLVIVPRSNRVDR